MKRTKTAIRNEIFFDLIAEFGYIKPSMAFEALKNTDAPVSKKTIATFVASFAREHNLVSRYAALNDRETEYYSQHPITGITAKSFASMRWR